jgi:pimeloyl-ACP methyl ester carboxylesterase
MGGRIALELASTQPQLAPRLLLLSASPGLPLTQAADVDANRAASREDETARAKRMAEDDARAAEILRDGLDAFVERWYQLPLFAPFAAHPSFNTTRLRRAQGEAAFWAQAIAGCSPGRTAPRWNSLSDIASRTLFAAGALDERYAAVAREAKARAPALRIEIAAQAGHVLPIEAPAFCAKLIGEFLTHQPDGLSKS